MLEHDCCQPSWGWLEEPHHHWHGPHHAFSRHCCCPCCFGAGLWEHAPFGFVRRFRTKEEKIAELEEYLEALKKEAQAVEEKIRRLRAE